MEGNGTYKWADDSIYEGEWFDNKRCGKGKMRYANGDVYEDRFNLGFEES